MKSVVTRLIPLAFVALTGCASTPAEEAPARPAWLAPSPVLERQIEDRIARVPWSHGQERIDLIVWFASVGEPTYPYLLELCSDPRPDVAAAALASLGATRDSRLVDHLHAVDWPEVLPQQVRFEQARAFVRLGDWSQVGVLVEGLGDEELWTRAWCFRALQESTNRTFDFDPKAPEEDRQEALAQWRDWAASRELEGILITQ